MRRLRRPRVIPLAALLAPVLSCAGPPPGDESGAPLPVFSAELSAQWRVPRGGHVLAAGERADSSVVVVSADGEVTVLNFDLTGRHDSTSSVLVPVRPASAATICGNGAVVVIGGSPRAIARLEAGATLASREVFPPSLGDVHALSCASADEVLLLVDPVLITVEHPALVRTNTLAVLLHAAGRVDTLASLPGHEFLLHGGTRGWSFPPFAGDLQTAVGTTLLYVGVTDQPAIQVLQANGHTVGSIAYVTEGTPIERSTVDSALRKLLRPFLTDFASSDYRVMLDSLASDRVTPPWTVLAADAEDNLWIGTTEGADAATRLWRVFSADGTPLQKLQLPSGFDVTHVTGDRVLGRWHATDAGEEVRRYLVRRSALATRPDH